MTSLPVPKVSAFLLKLQIAYSVLFFFGFQVGVCGWANVVGPNPNHVKTSSSACYAIHSVTDAQLHFPQIILPEL